MAAPIWITPKGSLGTIEEQQPYELSLNAYDPDGNNAALSYKIASGSLPAGLVMSPSGTISGQPSTNFVTRGVPFDVNQDITSTFCIRVTNSATKQITDRTFSLTVTGQDAPEIITPPRELGRFLDGKYVEIQLDAIDLDNEPIAWSINSGTLPPGLTLDAGTGLISGYILPTQDYELVNRVGWSTESSWDQDPWDFGSRAINSSYQFTVQVTDGKSYDGATYTIYVYSHDALTADNEFLTADIEQIVTADSDVRRRPALLTRADDLGTYAHDNYFAYRFEGIDFDGDAIAFSLLVGETVGFDNETNGFDDTLFDTGEFTLPPGLTLNSDTGWLHGQIPRLISGQTEYEFAVQVYKKEYPTYRSDLTFFTITIINDLGKLITWQTPKDLGTIYAGDISEKFVVASNERNANLLYTIVDGRLPQGLIMNTDGLIVGRSSFEIGSFDKGTTTFDVNSREQGFFTGGETTFDRARSFTVRASDSNGELVAFRTFTLKVLPRQYDPYESLYLRAQPGLEDKQLISAIFNNSDAIPDSDLYRSSDPYFGRSKDLRMLLMSGINASLPTEYIQAMATNHYRKVLKLGDYSWAQALNDDGSVAYEVVYLPIIDDLSRIEYRVATQTNELETTFSVPDVISLNTRLTRYTTSDSNLVATSSAIVRIDGSDNLYGYPNSLINMRKVMRENLGQQGKEPLPRWMISKQEDGRILGWIPAVPVVYVKPGAGAKVVFNLNRRAAGDIKTVSFDVDRYVWDMNLSKTYDANTNSYYESKETTFDANAPLLQNPVATVDYAVEVPFSSIDGRTINYIDDVLGGLDGVISSYVGSRIVFAKQENYEGFVGEEDGWIRYGSLWDSDYGWDSDTEGWDEYAVIPGYEQWLDDSTLNQRAAVWIIEIGENGELRLEVDQYIEPGNSVLVSNGAEYGGRIIQYGPLIYYSENETVPNYRYIEDLLDSQETVFDGQATRFISNVSIYQEPDEGDKYLAFPRTNIWA